MKLVILSFSWAKYILVVGSPCALYHRFTKSPINNKFQANNHQLVYKIAKLENIGHRNITGVYINILDCSPTRNMVFIGFKMVQVQLIPK